MTHELPSQKKISEHPAKFLTQTNIHLDKLHGEKAFNATQVECKFVLNGALLGLFTRSTRWRFVQTQRSKRFRGITKKYPRFWVAVKKNNRVGETFAEGY